MKAMVEYACEKVPVYRELGIDQFNKLPVVNKGIINFQGIIANSEKLCDQIRKTLESHFGCPVFSRYSNEELGILAQETKDSGHRF